MRNVVDFLTGNLILNLSILAWAVAQVLKVIVVLFQKHKLDWRFVVSGGGMPSSHSAFVCALAVSVGILYGWSGPLFALAAGMAVVVMYDACNVRWSTGEQAKALNELLSSMEQLPESLQGRRLKEALGHTPFQVLMGALLGIAVGCLALVLR